MIARLREWLSKPRIDTTRDERMWSTVPYRITQSGVDMDPQRAETLSAVWRATRLIAESVGKMPVSVRRNSGEHGSKVAYDHPLYKILHRCPCSELDAYQWFAMQVCFQIAYGNAFAEIQRDMDGSVKGLWPIHPTRIPLANIRRGPVRTSYGDIGDEGELIYLVDENNGKRAIRAADMLHVLGNGTESGLYGKSLVVVAAEALGVVAATEQHVGAFYRNGATPDIVIKFPANVPEQERENLRKSWTSKHAGSRNAHTALVLGNGADVATVGVNPNDAQLIDGRKFGVAEVSRFWGVPMPLLSSMESATFNNAETLGRMFVQYTLSSYVTAWEMAIQRQLMAGDETHFVKFNMDALQRGDLTARATYYKEVFNLGAITTNEIRELEDRNPVEGGDRPFISANNLVPLDRIDDLVVLQNETPDEPDDEEKPEPDTRTAALMMRDATLADMRDYEARRAVDAARNNAAFLKWMERFYGETFPALYVRTLSPVAAVLRSAGIVFNVNDSLDTHVAQSRASLLKAMEVSPSEFEASVKAWAQTRGAA